MLFGHFLFLQYLCSSLKYSYMGIFGFFGKKNKETLDFTIFHIKIKISKIMPNFVITYSHKKSIFHNIYFVH